MSISTAAEPQYVWELISPKAARDGAGALSFQGKIWLLGGWNLNPAERSFFPRICNNEVWASGECRDWMLVKPNTFKDRPFDSSSVWEGRRTAGYVVFRDRMWIVGGDCNQGTCQNDVCSSTDDKT